MIDRARRRTGARGLLVLLGGFLWAQIAPAQGLIQTGPPPDLFLLFTGDVIGYVDPCG